MKFSDKIKDLWRAFESAGLPRYVRTCDKLTFWRERIFFIIILLVVFFSAVRLIPIMIFSYSNGHWMIAGFSMLACFLSFFLLFCRNTISLFGRTWLLYAVFYIFGITLLYYFGFDGKGHETFFRASVIVGMMLGMKAAIIAVSINFVFTVILFVLAFVPGFEAWLPQGAGTFELWSGVMINSMISNIIITFIFVFLFDGIDDLLFKSQETVDVLKESEEKLKGTFEASPDPMVVYNADGFPQYLNSAFVDVFGWTMDELAGRKIPFVPKDQEKISRQHIDKLFRTGNPVEVETKRITKYGKVIDVLLKAAVIKDSDGKPMGTIVNLADITGSKKLEKQLRQARKMEAIGTLAGGIAHDFNNILQIINGYADITIMDKKKGSPDYQNLETILDAADRAAKLIRQLLLFSRKVETETKVLNPNHEIKQAANILSRTIPKMISIRTHLSERLWNVKADPVQIEQVFLNLGANAADAMPTGGRMVLKTANVRITKESINEIAGMIPGDYVMLTISDTGHGMDEGIMEHIFEPFFTTKDVGKGTGLGLSSCYGIVKKHKGHITCSSQPGKGTVFKIYLPAYKEKEWIVEEMDDTTTLIGGTETVLIVDDEATIRGFSSKALVHFGYKVIDCSSGEAALDIYEKQFNDIDLVLLDIGMPGMGGYKCFEEMLNINPDARIMITTGYSKDDKVRKALNSGAASYLGKPYKLSFLLKSVRDTLDNKVSHTEQLRN